MAFVSWAAVLADLREVIANRKPMDWFLSSYENQREMRVTYTKLGNLTEFYEWVAAKAADEELGAPGSFQSSIAG